MTTLAVAWLATPLPVFAQNYQTIDPLGSTYTMAQSINDNGHIVGFYLDSNRVEHGLVEADSVGTDATDINSLGQIVGVYATAGSPQLGLNDRMPCINR